MNKDEEKDNIPVIIHDYMTSDQISKMKWSESKGLVKDTLIWLFNLVPYVGGAMASEITAVNTFRQLNFFRKFLRFIYEIKDTSEKVREKFMNDVESAPRDFSGNVIADMVDRTDNINKAVVLAHLVKAKMDGMIGIEDFFRLSAVVERIPYTDFKYLDKFQNDNYIEGGITELLYSTGVLEETVQDYGTLSEKDSDNKATHNLFALSFG